MFRVIKKATLALAVGIAVFTGPAALAAGQIEGGNIYRVRNVTQNGQFTDPASATCGDTVQFRVRIHNPGPGSINNVKVAATLPAAEAQSHSSTVTVSANDAPNVATDTAGVNLNKPGKLSYVSGSTELLDPNGSKLQNLADGIIGGGVTLPSPVGVSTNQLRLVQFSAKVDCETPPQPQPSVVCDALTAEYIGSTKVPAKIKFTAKATAKDGAVINGYIFNFGDGEKTEGTNATVEHTYNKAGEYKATVQVKSTLGTTEIVDRCAVVIKVTEDQPPVIVPPTPETPVTPQTPGSPSVLPSTGPEAALTGLFGTGALGYGVRQFIASRRRLSALLEQ